MPTNMVSLALFMIAAHAPLPTEWLVPQDRPSLAIAEESRTDLRTKIVYVGRGETPQTWTRRITTWFYPDLVMTAPEFRVWIEGLRKEVLADCPGAGGSALRAHEWEGLPAAEFSVVCHFYPVTGRQDIYLVRSIQGHSGQLAAAITFKQAPTEAELRAASAYLDTLVLCTGASKETACRAR